jgi:hypothetical protein
MSLNIANKFLSEFFCFIYDNCGARIYFNIVGGGVPYDAAVAYVVHDT